MLLKSFLLPCNLALNSQLKIVILTLLYKKKNPKYLAGDLWLTLH